MRLKTWLGACLLCWVALAAGVPASQAQTLDLDRLKKAGQQLLREPKKLDPSKLPKRLNIKLPTKLEKPKEASQKQPKKLRLASYVSADDLKKVRAALEKSASSAAKSELAEVQEYVKKKKLGFSVGLTSASGVPLKHLAGTLPPTAEELAQRPEQAAIAEAIVKRWREAASRNKSARAEPPSTLDESGAPSPNASYYAAALSGAAAASWMDPKSYALPRACDVKATRWVPRDALPPVREQGNCGSCWAFSALSAFEVSQAYLNGVFYDFSEQSMINCAVTSLGKEAGNCNGGWPHNVYDFVNRFGPATEAVVPYVSKKASCAENTLTAYTGVTYAPVDPKKVRADASKIKSALCQYGAISTIVPATRAFNNYISGVFKEPGVTYWDNNAHAVVLVGWDDEKKAWLLRNSWGVGWGEAGYMWVDYETYAAADERYRGNEYWVVAAPGDGGSKGHGSTLGAWYTRSPRIENATGQALTLKVQYAGWTGVDGMRWLPQANAWYSYTIPAGFKGELTSPFIGALRASKIRLHAVTADGQQEWVEHRETPIDLVPEGGYWAEAAETFDIKIGTDAIFPASPMSVADASASSTNCTSFNISRIAYSASEEYEWDEGTAPDLLLELKFDKTSLRSPVGLDSFDHVWDFPTSEPLVLKPDTKLTLTVFDQDFDAEQSMEALSATVPKTFPSGVWTTKGKYGELSFTGSCTGLRPSVVNATLPSSMKQRGKLYFGGEATDAAGLKSITATVSGPKGNNLALFSDTKVSGKKVALSAYAFDSESTKYAGVAGNYTIVLTATNSAGLTGAKSFHLKVELPPSLAKATLAASLNQLGTLNFGGSVSDDGALKAISAKVSGPKGNDFALFSDTLSGSSKDLTAYSFNAADPRYAGVSGTYTIVLSATDDTGLVAEKSFKLAVNLPPSLGAVTLPTWVASSEKITFGGSVTDDVGLKSVKATVSGPRGEKLALFSASSLSGTEHELSAYTFDSGDTTYAGQEGTYSIELSVSDASDLTTSKLFKVAVVSPKLTLGPVLSTGTGHTCALRKAGDVVCWGMGTSGQLGNGASRNSNFPLPVLNLTDVLTLSAGATHSCAVKNSGEVWCWGAGAGGKLGNGATRNSNLPVQVTDLTDVVSVSAGAAHSCAVKRNGEVWCWGAGASGKLGNGSTRNSSLPVQVTGLTDASAVSAGTTHSCAAKKSGEVVCWGAGASGKLGNGATRNSNAPVAVSGLVDALSVSTSATNSCALRASGEVACWGSGAAGRLGNGTTRNSTVPVTVSNLDDAVALSLGAAHACALRKSGEVMCWGTGASGRLGNAASRNSTVPVAVLGLSGGASAISTGQTHSCAQQTDGPLACWGAGAAGRLGTGSTRISTSAVAVSELADVLSASVGASHSCAVRPDASVVCWGAGGSGRLGNGTTRTSSLPLQVSELTDARAVVVGTAHSCALRSDGSVLCWGAGGSGRLGNGSTRNSGLPVPVSGLSDAVSLSAGATHTCAQRADGTRACWGSGKFDGVRKQVSSLPLTLE